MTPERIVIAGGGQAAAQTVDELLRLKFPGQIVLVSDEPELPYQRPPLSKQFLAGAVPEPWLYYRPFSFYADPRITLRLGVAVVAIDRKARAIVLDTGERIGFDRLLVATGSRPRRLPVPGESHERVCYVRTVADVRRVRSLLGGNSRIVIVGGGFVGLEAAAALTPLGHHVTVVEAAERTLSRAVARPVSDFLETVHRAHGVTFRLCAQVATIDEAAPLAVRLTCGERILADLVIVGVGIIPNSELAEAAGLTCYDGILVDEQCRTNDPDIFAAGDCTRHPNPLYGRMMRLETVHNAIEQGRTAAHAMLGLPARYNQAPWVWSDQYGHRIQSVGDAAGHDRIILRGDPAGGRFSMLYTDKERLLALVAINRPDDFAAARIILNAGEPMDFESAEDLRLGLLPSSSKLATMWFEGARFARLESQEPKRPLSKSAAH